jgi:hypothetical protein
MVYDSAIRRIVLFGGDNGPNTPANVQNATWLWHQALGQ